MNKFMIVLVAILLLAYGTCDNPVGPNGPEPDTTTIPESKPPIVAEPFTWDGSAGFSLFAGLVLDSQGIQAAWTQALSHGRNTARVCAETEYWNGSPQYPSIPRNPDRLDAFLDTVARIPGAQVLLMGNCTLKHGPHDTAQPLGPQYEWNIKVAKIAAKYPNVALEVVNEPWRFNQVPESAVNRMIADAHRQGVQMVGADDSICKGDRARYAYRGADFVSWHPCRIVNREPWDPSQAILQEWADRNGGMVVLSETVAWDDNGDQCSNGLRTCDKGRIERYQRRCNRASDCVFFFHSEDGLAARVPMSWMALAN